MDSKDFLSFYNHTVSNTKTINSLVNDYIDFITTHYDNITLGFGALIEGGSYHIVKTSCQTEIPTLHNPLHTHNISKELYDLEPLQVVTSKKDTDYAHHESFPFLSTDAIKQLCQHLCIRNDITTQIIQFNIFHNNYLVVQLSFLVEDSLYDNENIDPWLLFMRNAIQCSIEPIFDKDISKKTQQIMKTTEQIIASKHYISSDPSLFMSRLLDLAMEILDEPDYGSALLYNKYYWNFVHAIGHDAELLTKVNLPEDVYSRHSILWESYREVAPNVFLVDKILDVNMSEYNEEEAKTFDIINKASRPIKQTIQLRIEFNNNSRGIISLDIKKDSPFSFTTKTIDVLKQLHLLGQILFNYTSLNAYSKNFENLTSLISTFISSSSEGDTDFLHNFLLLLINSIYEADYASAYLKDDKGIYFLDSIGHDINALKNLKLKPEYFIEMSPDDHIQSHDKHLHHIHANIYEDIYSYTEANMPDEIYQEYIKASRPIKDGLISHTLLDNGVYMNISIDIKEGSPLGFTKESIKSFKMLNNLGFAFISNKYYIDKYKTLNEELESTIKTRTLELEKTNAKLQQLVLRDSLTGLYNHKAIIDQLNDMISSVQPLSIFLFDIDHFKLVNDLYGHQRGDQVLEGISELLMEYDHIISGRYGGEEFLLLMPYFDLTEAVEFSEHIRRKISEFDFIPDQRITVSGGVTCNKKGSAIKLIKTADTLLYSAKENGRNQIASAYCK